MNFISNDFTILVVDDNQENLKLISNLLRQEAYKLALALNGKEALIILQEIKVDLILLDVMMPEMNGYELCEIIKSKTELKNIPIIFITALNDTQSIVKGFEYGGVDYINKPFRDKELIARVKTHLHLKESLKMLEETIRSKDRLHSIIAHDLRSPLGSIQMLLEALKSIKMDEETFSQLVDNLSKSTRETSDLLENLLYWSKTQIGELNPAPCELNLKFLIDESLDGFKSNAHRKKIELKNRSIDGLTVYADQFMLRTVLRNMISNAIKFTSQGGTIEINSIHKGNQVIIRIIDNGIGINKDTLHTIFSQKKYITTLGTDKEKGSGLGLKLCYDFIQLMNGEITVESQVGEGSTFNIILPQNPGNDH